MKNVVFDTRLVLLCVARCLSD